MIIEDLSWNDGLVQKRSSTWCCRTDVKDKENLKSTFIVPEISVTLILQRLNE